jgi:hypothetical protein
MDVPFIEQVSLELGVEQILLDFQAESYSAGAA